VFVKHEPSTQSTYLTRRGGGGAVIAMLETGIVIGMWLKDELMSDKMPQNQAVCAE
jgi:hypothetical protein